MPKRRRSPRKGGFFIRSHGSIRPRIFYMRSKIIIKYRALLKRFAYKLRISEKVCEVMIVCRQDGEYLTRGELIAIMREPLLMNEPNDYELKHLHNEIFRFRKWLGTMAGMLLYAEKREIHEKDFEGTDWIYRPLRNKTEYKQMRKHIRNIKSGLEQRMDDNDEFLSLSEREINRRIQEVADQLDLKAEGYER